MIINTHSIIASDLYGARLHGLNLSDLTLQELSMLYAYYVCQWGPDFSLCQPVLDEFEKRETNGIRGH